jgi:hypothetical protein
MTGHEVELTLLDVVLAIPKSRKQPFEDPAMATHQEAARAAAPQEIEQRYRPKMDRRRLPQGTLGEKSLSQFHLAQKRNEARITMKDS